jgi:hypothetical protein
MGTIPVPQNAEFYSLLFLCGVNDSKYSLLTKTFDSVIIVPLEVIHCRILSIVYI